MPLFFSKSVKDVGREYTTVVSEKYWSRAATENWASFEENFTLDLFLLLNIFISEMFVHLL